MFGNFLKTALIKQGDFSSYSVEKYFDEWSDQFWPRSFDVDWEEDGTGIRNALKDMANNGVTGFVTIMFTPDDIRMFIVDPFSETVSVMRGSVVIREETTEVF